MSTALRIGAVVRFHRKESGLTQKELADLAGVGVSSVYTIEHGKDSVQLETLLKVLSILNITLSVAGPLMETLEEKPGRRDETPGGGSGLSGETR
jgi:HTH-type transcriptional regulator/antitoxin HipB